MKSGRKEKGRRKKREEWRNSKGLRSEERWDHFYIFHSWISVSTPLGEFLLYHQLSLALSEIDILLLLFCDSNILPMWHTYGTFRKGVKGVLLKPLERGIGEIIDPFSLSTFIIIHSSEYVEYAHNIGVTTSLCKLQRRYTIAVRRHLLPGNSTRCNLLFHLTSCHETKNKAEWLMMRMLKKKLLWHLLKWKNNPLFRTIVISVKTMQ